MKIIKAILIFFLIIFSVAAKRSVFVGRVVSIHPLVMKGLSFSFITPAGSYQKLFEIENALKSYTCLYYKVPLSVESEGLLYQVSSSKPCLLVDLKGVKPFFQNIKELKVFDIDLKKRMSFKLRLKMKDSEISLEYFLPFVAREKSYWPGLFPAYTFSSPKESFVKFGNGDVCHQGCGELQYLCNDCPNSQWTQTLSLKCASEISGICGDNLCGGRGQVACVRMSALKRELSCEEVKAFVYCSYGREVECQNNGKVTCR